MSKRLAKRAAIKIGTASGKAVPFLGIALVAGGVTWAIYEICEDLKEIHELKKAFDPFAVFKPEEEKACGLSVSTEAKIRETVLESPQLVWMRPRIYFNNFMEDFKASRAIFNEAVFSLKDAAVYASIPHHPVCNDLIIKANCFNRSQGCLYQYYFISFSKICIFK